MRRTWFSVREPEVAEAFGARVSGQVPMAASAGAARVSHKATRTRSWWAIGVRLIRNAVIAAVLMTAVPLTRSR